MRRCPNAAAVRFPKRRPTWSMTAGQLARVVGDRQGVHAHRDGGGWLYTKDERPLVQGWARYAVLLEAAGMIEVGRGIVWSKVGGLS